MNSDSQKSQSVETESERIDRLVKERIAYAQSKGIGKLANEMYQACIYYPSWINLPPRDHVPDIVLEAHKEKTLNERGKSRESIRLKLKNGEICFSLAETYPGEQGMSYGNLEITWNSSVVLIMGMAINHNDDDLYVSAEWYPTGIEGYIEGPWEYELENLKRAIADQKVERENNKKEDPARIADLKKKFGL